MIPRPTFVRLATFVATVVAAWGVLSLGAEPATSVLQEGALAEQVYTAENEADVPHVANTEAAKEAARNAVEPVFRIDTGVQNSVQSGITSLFETIQAQILAEPAESTPPTSSTTTTSEPTSEEETTATTLPPEPVQVSGLVFVDVDGDGLFQPEVFNEQGFADFGLSGAPVTVESGGEAVSVPTGADGMVATEALEGQVTIVVDIDRSPHANKFVLADITAPVSVDCVPGEPCEIGAIAVVPNLRPVDEVVAGIRSVNPRLAADALTTLVGLAQGDVLRAAAGQQNPLHLAEVQREVINRVLQEFGGLITPDELLGVQGQQITGPPPVLLPGETSINPEASMAAGEVVATYLQANYLEDVDATDQDRIAAAAAVPDDIQHFRAGEIIARENEPLTQFQIDAIDLTSGASEAQQQGGLLAVLAVLIGVLGLYLSRFRPEFWARPRMVALLGILIVLAAGTVKATELLQTSTSWYVLPAVAFGFMAAVLFDSRIAVLMALCMGVLVAAGTLDTGIAVYGALATMAPIPFVSSVSSRGAFRNAVVLSSLTAAVAAGATSWFFHALPNDTPFTLFGLPLEVPLGLIGTSMAWAFAVSVVASLVGLAALQFFESAFDITTSLSLLDLTDRNHEALQLLQEKAFGTFNHSLMVGTLAHSAARAIGANALLARAMAYYHDLGKTENPTMFIENQFGMQNPHDLLTPKESAEIVRRHVSDGILLADQFKIPSDVATGIVSHHGDGIIRYFYEKAREQDGENVDPDDFRHIGHKPRTAESAIVMLADSLEAACRAVFQTEEPKPEAIEKVVDRVIDEKLNDGQLSESPLTLFELTQIRTAFLDSLVGHYHQRIAYPNFPGT
ncbi:MAG TPA: HDIG domain-containing protein [Acidimicrobiia bacterium]